MEREEREERGGDMAHYLLTFPIAGDTKWPVADHDQIRRLWLLERNSDQSGGLGQGQME